MRLLLTAFEPFGGDEENAALLAMGLLPERIGETELAKAVLPVSYGRSFPALVEAWEKERPDAILCLGQAKGRKGLTPERVGLNLDDATIPDNDGAMPLEEKILPDGENAYFSTMPVRAMCDAIRLAHIPAAVSTSAGTFVCNHVLYLLLHRVHTKYPGMRAGFLHVPCTPEQAGERTDLFTLPAEEIAKGITLAIRAMAEDA